MISIDAYNPFPQSPCLYSGYFLGITGFAHFCMGLG